jgi:CRP/FNR family transcriptional regulator, cyclic AMP receptor protein
MQAEIASKVSTYREQVTREFALLTRLGILSRAGGTLVVCDVAGLERIVAHARCAD